METLRLRKLTWAKLVKVKLGPVADSLLFSDSFQLLDLLLCVGFNEFLDDHVASSDSDDELAVDDLSVNLTGSEHVETIAESSDWDGAAGNAEEVSEQFINLVSFDGFVV